MQRRLSTTEEEEEENEEEEDKQHHQQSDEEEKPVKKSKGKSKKEKNKSPRVRCGSGDVFSSVSVTNFISCSVSVMVKISVQRPGRPSTGKCPTSSDPHRGSLMSSPGNLPSFLKWVMR